MRIFVRVKQCSNTIMAKLVSADLTNGELCKLTYTTSDGEMLSLKGNAFDAKIISHSYTDKGVVIFDKPITSIGEGAFAYCTSLINITIPDSVTSIGYNAFDGCKCLQHIFIGNKVSLIKSNAFYDCTSLQNVYISDLSSWCKIDFESYCSNPLSNKAKLYLNEIEITEIIIPEDIVEVKKAAFFGCCSLTDVTISNNVTLINDDCFACCESLINVAISDSVTYIGKYAFLGCKNLQSVVINNGVTTIDEGAFCQCRSLTSVSIPNSVSSIGNEAFEECYSLTSITIGNGVTSIGTSAFIFCDSLQSVYISDLYAWCKINFESGESNPLFYGASLYVSNVEIKEMDNLPDVTEIKQFAFRGCSSLAGVVIPDSVTKIGDEAFCNCNNLTRVIIGSSVTSIGKRAFEHCSIGTVICRSAIPPKLDEAFNLDMRTYSLTSFERFETLIVPIGREEAYSNSDWGRYLREENVRYNRYNTVTSEAEECREKGHEAYYADYDNDAEYESYLALGGDPDKYESGCLDDYMDSIGL